MASRTRVLVRVDGNHEVGMGHLTRCLTLARALQQMLGEDILFVLKGSKEGISKVAENKFAWVELAPVARQKEELQALERILDAFHPELCIVDLVHVDPEYVAAFKKGNPSVVSICLLDCCEPLAVPSDIVINHNINQRKEFYQGDHAGTEYYLGPGYVLLDPAFAAQRGRGRSRAEGKLEMVFVNQGGSDPFGLTARVIQGLELISEEFETVLVLGGAMREQHVNQLRGLLSRASKKYVVKRNISNLEMAKSMARCSLAITAAGNTLYELLCLGLPSIVVGHHERHDEVARAFAQRGAVINVGIGVRVSAAAISEAVWSLMRNAALKDELGQRGTDIVDGKGLDRVIRIIRQKLAGSQVGA